MPSGTWPTPSTPACVTAVPDPAPINWSKYMLRTSDDAFIAGWFDRDEALFLERAINFYLAQHPSEWPWS